MREREKDVCHSFCFIIWSSVKTACVWGIGSFDFFFNDFQRGNKLLGFNDLALHQPPTMEQESLNMFVLSLGIDIVSKLLFPNLSSSAYTSLQPKKRYIQ
uniref:Uncharacterized protein n=1 Tax=Ditylum brightwellii TaxID=49249 RepID=A0A7S1Z3D6_9STRA